MSLGGGFAGYLNIAVDAAVDAGVVSVVAAGNSSVDACGSSPASAPKALTVGALSNNLSPAGFSNFGSCVDLYAPGAGITSLWLGSGTVTISGTSMASPHAAGVAALYIAANPTKTATEVTAALMAAGKVNCGACSPNKTLNIQNLALNPTQPPAPVVPSAPAAPTASNVTATGATLSWAAPTSNGGAEIDRYIVQYRLATSSTWQSVTVTAPTTSTTLTSLTGNTGYTFRVTAQNSAGSSAASIASASVTPAAGDRAASARWLAATSAGRCR
jgi:subtilisin family serine protease